MAETTPSEYLCKLIPDVMKVTDSESISGSLDPGAIAKLHEDFTKLPDLAKDHIMEALPSVRVA